MKAESTALAGQREKTCHEERERKSRHRPWIFFHFSSSNSYTCFLKGSVFTVVHPGSNFLTIFTLFWEVFTLVFTSLRLRANFQTPVVHLLPPGVWERKIWDLCFFLSFLMTVVIHPCLVDPQRVLWPDYPVVSWPFP